MSTQVGSSDKLSPQQLKNIKDELAKNNVETVQVDEIMKNLESMTIGVNDFKSSLNQISKYQDEKTHLSSVRVAIQDGDPGKESALLQAVQAIDPTSKKDMNRDAAKVTIEAISQALKDW